MATSKKFEFKEEDIILAEFAKALSHPARIEIMRILSEKSVCICGDIVELMPLAQSTVSQHLKELKSSGLITGEIEGPKTCYCINIETMKKAKEAFEKLFVSTYRCCGGKLNN